jgi:DNA-binding LacI/PurR family transcriptional regulator
MKKTARIMTLGDIAHQCGVSPSMFSRVLNNAPGISSAARKRILEVARQHNFILQKRRRPLARTQLKLMIVIPEESAITMNPFFDISELLNAVNNAFAQDWKQIEVISFSHFLERIRSKALHAHGIILAFGTIEKIARDFLIHEHIPYVFLNRNEQNYVSNNHYKGMLRLGEYLRAKGKTRIGYLGYRLSPINRDRFRGSMTMRFEATGTLDQESVHMVDSIDGINSLAAAFYLEKGCEAVMCFNDNFAIRLICKLQRLGKTIPGDISITGFDDSPLRQLFRPLITTISLSTYEMGFYASLWLKDNIIHRTSRRLNLEIEGKLIEGETVA